MEAKLYNESLFVDRFEEARAEVAMNLDRGPDHPMCPRVELPGRFLGVLGVLAVHPPVFVHVGSPVASRSRNLTH